MRAGGRCLGHLVCLPRRYHCSLALVLLPGSTLRDSGSSSLRRLLVVLRMPCDRPAPWPSHEVGRSVGARHRLPLVPRCCIGESRPRAAPLPVCRFAVSPRVASPECQQTETET